MEKLEKRQGMVLDIFLSLPHLSEDRCVEKPEKCCMHSPGFHPKMARQCSHPWKSITATRRRLKPSRRRPLSLELLAKLPSIHSHGPSRAQLHLSKKVPMEPMNQAKRARMPCCSSSVLAYVSRRKLYSIRALSCTGDVCFEGGKIKKSPVDALWTYASWLRADFKRPLGCDDDFRFSLWGRRGILINCG